MTWAPTEAQKRIYTILAGDAALQTLLGGANKVFDYVPQNVSYPYVTMQIRPMSDRGNHTLEGVSFEYQINVWYRGAGLGDLKVQEIQARIDELLHKQDICIEGWNVINHRRSSVNIIDDPDSVTKHGIQIFNLMLGEE